MAGDADGTGEAPLVDPDALAAFLRERLPGGDGDLAIERQRAGHSNETFFLRWGGRDLVLRRPPRGAFLPTAHDVGREHRVLAALASTPVRAPRPVLWCEDPSVIGAPFYLMERVGGDVIRDRLPPPFADHPAARARVGDEMVDALAELHAVDWRAVGLEGFGRPQGYLVRQVRRWGGQLDLTEPLTRPVPDLHRLRAWLEERLPAEGDATIVHGDYKLDNVAFDGAGRLVAVLDWEMSTIGDPLADLGWMLSFWSEPGEEPGFELDEEGLTRLPGFRSRAELVARYEGRTDGPVGDLTFYVVLAGWKLAILLEGSYARHLAGMTDDPFFARLGEGVPGLAARALAVARAGFG
jgi:aminoglycoside phosphotransferase (APT) family kinase protein